MKILHFFVRFPQKLIKYQEELQEKLESDFGVQMCVSKKCTLLEIPINADREKVIRDKVKRYLADVSEINIRISTQRSSELVSKSNSQVWISLSEKSWNRVVDFQKDVLRLLSKDIDTANPIVLKPETYWNDVPKGYLREYGTDNILKWYSGGIHIVNEGVYEKRKRIFQYVREGFPVDVGFRGKVEFELD